MPVKLTTCYYWDCPCGKRNFCDGVPVELTQEDRDEIADREGVDLDGLHAGDLIVMPDEVTCAACSRTHETIDPREADGQQWWER